MTDFNALVMHTAQEVLRRNCVNPSDDTRREVHNHVQLALELTRDTFRADAAKSIDSVMGALTLKPRAIEYTHLVGRYVSMTVNDLPEGETHGMDGLIAEVRDTADGVLIISDYGYGFPVTAEDAHRWSFTVWPDQATHDLLHDHGHAVPSISTNDVKEELAEIEVTLAQALGYAYDPSYGYAVGDHTPFTLAQEAARKLVELRESLRMAEQLRTSGMVGDE